jgi:hypothetical protein
MGVTHAHRFEAKRSVIDALRRQHGHRRRSSDTTAAAGRNRPALIDSKPRASASFEWARSSSTVMTGHPARLIATSGFVASQSSHRGLHPTSWLPLRPQLSAGTSTRLAACPYETLPRDSAASSMHDVCGDDDQSMRLFVGLNNYFPGGAHLPCLDDEAATHAREFAKSVGSLTRHGLATARPQLKSDLRRAFASKCHTLRRNGV